VCDVVTVQHTHFIPRLMGIVKKRRELCPHTLQWIRRFCPQPCWIIGFSTITLSKRNAILYQVIVGSLNPILHLPPFSLPPPFLCHCYPFLGGYMCMCVLCESFSPTPCRVTEPLFFPMHTNTHWEPLGHPQDCIVKLLLLLYVMRGRNNVGDGGVKPLSL
jgi:hypothetical protein